MCDIFEVQCMKVWSFIESFLLSQTAKKILILISICQSDEQILREFFLIHGELDLSVWRPPVIMTSWKQWRCRLRRQLKLPACCAVIESTILRQRKCESRGSRHCVEIYVNSKIYCCSQMLLNIFTYIYYYVLVSSVRTTYSADNKNVPRHRSFLLVDFFIIFVPLETGMNTLQRSYKICNFTLTVSLH